MKDNQQEMFPIVDEEGKVIGQATRGECHSGSKLLHPVVHLHVFNSKGEIYLQKRPEWKDIQPGKWDTAVGGHIDCGETPETALQREVREELGIHDFTPVFVDKYVFESQRERELVYLHRTTYDGNIQPSADELEDGRFWTIQEISDAIGKNVLTPNFESEFQRFFMKRRKVAIDIVKANWFAMAIMAVSAIVFLVPFFLIWHSRKPIGDLFGGSGAWGLALVLMVVGIAVHELIHGLTWACYAKRGWKSINFGVMWKLLTPYCHCDEPMRIPGYMMGAMMPCIILGVIPAITALFIGNLPLLVWGIFFIAAAAGDIWMTWLLTKEKPDSLVLDHPSEAGFYIIEE